jgi:hypothetical protein
MKVWLHLPGRIDEKAEADVEYEKNDLLCLVMTPLPPWWYEIDAQAPPNAVQTMVILRREGDRYIEATLDAELCVVRE